MLNLNEVSKKVNDFIKYLSSHGVSSNSLKYYKSDIINFFNWTNGRIINSSLVKEYIASQLGTSSLKTINRRLSTLRSFSQSIGESFMAGIGNVSVNGIKKVVEPNKILDFDKFLINQKVSNNTRKNYLSDIRKFLVWKKDTEGGAKEYLNNLPVASYDRNSASLKKFYEFQNKSFPVSTNQIPKNSPYRFIQELILNKLDSKPRLQNVFHKVFFNRPNWYKRYHSYPVATYIHIAILVLITSISGYAIYDQVFKNANNISAYPATAETPNRFLSFQGRLTDNLGNPKIVATNLVFKLYDAASAGTTLWDSTTCSITPDGDGIFSTLLGSSCGGAIAATVFSENADVWLGITIGTDAEATPRIRIATVGYALNSETLQGFPPGTGVSSIPFIDSTGKLQIAAASPTIESTSGTFAVTGQAMTISTANTTNGAITINPDGTGTLDLTFEGAAAGGAVNGFINATNANITSGALYGGTVASAATGYNFIDFQSGVSPTSKFSVSSTGQITSASGLTIGTTSLSETTAANDSGAYLVGTFGEFTNSSSSNVQDVLDDLDAAITTGTTPKWNALTNPDGNLSLTMGTNLTTFNWATGTSTNNLLSLTSDASANGTGSLLNIQTGTSSTLSPFRVRAGAVESIFVKSDGNVGIGTTAPVAGLDVQTGGGAIAALTSVPNGALSIGGAGTNAIISMGVNGGNAAWIQGRLRVASGTTLDLALNPLGGNVGIGTTNPGVKLHISGVGTGGFVTTRLEGDRGSYNVPSTVISLQNRGTDIASITALTGISTYQNYGQLTFNTANNSTLIERMRIDENGNVGIGTTNPLSLLDVFQSADGYDKGLTIERTGATRGTVYLNASDNTFNFARSNIPFLTASAVGNVGIGTTAPNNKLQIVGPNTDTIALSNASLSLGSLDATNAYWGFRLGSSGNDLFIDKRYSSTDSNVMTFQRSTGYIGIGTTNPLAGLHVGTGGTPGSTGANDVYIQNDLEVDGTIYGTFSGTGFVGGSGTDNYIPRWNGTTNLENSLIFDNGTNIGIGTTSPTQKLDVVGSINASTGILLNGANINTAGTLNNVAYLNQANAFTANQNFNLGFDVDDAFVVADGGALTTSQTATVNNNLSANRLYQLTNGAPTSNLGVPSITEMALFDEQFNNKTAFYDINNIYVETSADGTTWGDAGVTDDQKRKLVGGDSNSTLAIPYGTAYFRVRFRATSYVYLNALYSYWSSNGHSTQVQIYKQHDDGPYTQHTSSTTTVSSWPGHLYLPFATIPFHPTGTLGTHYMEVSIVFIPTWNGTYPSNNINLYKMQLWGGYPAGKRNIYAVDEYQNMTLPANLTLNAASTVLNFSSATGAKQIQTGGSTHLALMPGGTGNVGIGTTAPGAKLDVAGNVIVQGTTGLTFSTGAGGDITFALGEKIDNDTDGTLLLTATTTKSSGNLYVGTSGTGTITSGTINGQTISSTASFTGTVGVTTSVSSPTYTGSGAVSLTAGGTAQILSLDGSTTGAVNIAGTSTGGVNIAGSGTGDVAIAGGSGSTGCTITNSNGNLACSGTISGSGIVASSLKWNALTVPDGDLTLAMDADTTTFNWDTLTTGTGFTFGSTSLSSGALQALTVNSTAAASDTQKVLSLSTAGANATSNQVTYGLYSTNTHTGTGSNNIGGYFSASGGTYNYAAIFADGNVGIGITSPTNKLEIGTSSGQNVANALYIYNQDRTYAGENYGQQILSLIGTPGTLAYERGGLHVRASAMVADSRSNAGDQVGIKVQNGITNNTTGVFSGTVYGIKMVDANKTGSGTFPTNFYQVYLGSTSSLATNNWGIYQTDSTAKNYFAGNVGIGTTNPLGKLDIKTGTTSGIYLNDRSGNPEFKLYDTGSPYLYFSPKGDYTVFSSQSNTSIMQIEGSVASKIRFYGSTSNVIYTNSGDLTITPAVNTIFSSGNVGIGTTNPLAGLHVGTGGTPGSTGANDVYIQNDLEVDGTIYGTFSGTGFVGGSGTDNYIPRWNGTTNLENSLIFDNGTNIGIGTTGPLSKLHIDSANTATDSKGNLFVSTTDTLAINKGGQISLGGQWSTGSAPTTFAAIAGRKENATDGSAAGYLQLSTALSAGGSVTEKMRISNAGNVGIGNTNPQYLLHLPNNGAYVNKWDTSGNLSTGGSVSTKTFTDYDDTSYYLDPANGATSLKVAGNVGIGTTNPQATLEVGGNIRGYMPGAGNGISFYNTISSGTHILSITRQESPSTASVSLSSYGGIGFATGKTSASTSYAMTIDNTGNVGIGTTAPTAKLHIVGTADDEQLIVKANATQTANILEIQDSSGTALTSISGTGNLRTNNIGFFDTAPSATAGIYASKTFTDPTNLTTLFQFQPISVYTGAESVYENLWQMRLYGVTTINTGHTNTGQQIGMESSVYRNTQAAGTDDSGTLTDLIAFNASYGNGNTNAAATPITTNVYGLKLKPVYGTGTITNLYDIYHDAPTVTTGTVVNRYGIYMNSISGATTSNYAILTNAGKIVFNEGGDSATDFRVEGDTDTSLLFTDASADKVGIGTTAPGAKLEIYGHNQRLKFVESSDPTNYYTEIGMDYNIPESFRISVTGHDIIAARYSGELFLQPDGGYVGIGTTNPLAGLHVGTGGTPGNTGANDVYIQNDLEVDGTIYGTFSGTGFVGGSGTDNYIPRWNGTTNLENSLIFDDGTNIGIGTTGPSNGKLELVQTTDINTGGISVTNSSLNRSTRLWTDSSNNSRIDSGSTAAGNILLNGSGTGNVGIGITSPASKLHVWTGNSALTSTTPGVNIESNTHQYIQMLGRADTQQGLLIAGGSSTYLNDGGIIWEDGTRGNRLDLYAGNAVTLSILGSNGNVGIGTTGPNNKLTVVGNIGLPQSYGIADEVYPAYQYISPKFDANYNMVLNSAGGIYLNLDGDNNATTNVFQIGSNAKGTSATPLVTVLENGNVGIGTTNPSQKLEIADVVSGSPIIKLSTANSQLYGTVSYTSVGNTNLAITNSYSSGLINLFTGSSGLTINTGNVGIGITSPTAKLHIVGSANTQQLIVKGNATQTTNIQEWQNSSGTVLGSINGTGLVDLNSTSTDETTSTTGIDLTLTKTSAGADANNIYGIASTVRTAGTQNYSGAAIGIAGTSYHASSGTLTNQFGLYYIAGITGSGNVTTTRLIDIRTYSTGAGVISNLTGLYIRDLGAYSTPVTSYGIRMENNIGAVGTSKYGLYMGDISGAATNNYAMVTNAGKIVFNEGGDSATDFRVEGDTDANLLFVDASADNIGIGVVDPDTQLEVFHAGNQLKLSFDATDNTTFGVDTDGNLTIDASGTKTIVSDDLQIGGADILDTNGNEFLRFTSAASAVDELTIANAAANGVVTMAATGGDTDIALSIDSKGADALNLNGTATGDVNIAGGSGSTGCTITNSNGNLACSGTITGTIVASSLKWNSLTDPDGNLALTMADKTSTFTYNATTGAGVNLFNLTDTNSNTGTGYLMNLTTGTSSALHPLHVAAGGVEALTVDTTGYVGIGTTGPVAKLEVADSTGPGVVLRLTDTGQIGTAGDEYGRIEFYTGDSSTYGNDVMAKIRAVSEAVNDNYGNLSFQVRTTGDAGDTPTWKDAMYIQHTGNVGIGTTAPVAKLQITGTADDEQLIVKGYSSQTLNLQEWQDSTGTKLAGVTADGRTFTKINAPVDDMTSSTIRGAYTNTSGSSKGIYLQSSISPASASSGGHYGIYANPVSAGANNISYLVGVGNIATNQSTGTLASLYGGLYITQNTGVGSTVTNSYAGYFRTDANDGTIGNNYGIYVEAPGGTGTITTNYGARIYNQGRANVTNAYGLYINSQSGAATLNYAIVTNAGHVVFNEGGDASTDFRVEGDTDAGLLFTDASADKVGIGTTAPTNAKLDIASSGTTAVAWGYGGARVKSLSASATSPWDILAINSNGYTSSWRGAIDLNVSYNGGTLFTALTARANTDGTTANVGIGTTAPGAMLDVAGNVIVQGTTGLTFSTGAGGDITFALGEKIDNDTDGTITITAPTTSLSGDLTVTGGNISVSNNNGGIDFSDVNSYWLRTATNYGLYWDTTNNTWEWHAAGVDKWSVDLSGNIIQAGDLAVNGATSADITSSTTTATVFDTTVTTLSMGGAATTLNIGVTNAVTRAINIGTGTGVDTIHIGDNVTGADVITIGSSGAGAVTVQSAAALTLHGEANSIIDFPGFDVNSSGIISTIDSVAHTIDDVAADLTLTSNSTYVSVADNLAVTGDLKLTGADILDTNGNEFLRFTATGSAVDELTIANAAGGGVVTIAATGGDTDIALSIDAKGADAVNIAGTSTGGVNIAGSGTGDVAIAGGSDSTGCTIVNSSGNLTCTGTISGGTILATSLKWNALTAPDGNLSLAMDADTTTFGWTATGALDAWTHNFTNSGATSTTQNAFVINNAANGSATTDVLTENLLLIQQLDTATGDSKVVGNALKIDVAGAAGMTNGINITNSAGNLTTGITIADTAGGTLTTGIAITGTVTNAMDAGNFPIINIGAANTDFNTSGGLTLAENLVVQGTTGLTFNTGVGGDITFALGEKIDNDSDGTIAITATTTALSGNLKVTGGNILDSAGTANIIFSATPTTTANTLSASSWLIENTANVGLAALMVNQTKLGDLFTASASGSAKFVITNAGDVGIGTTVPGGKLDVHGNLHIGSGSNLNFDGGNPTIQSIFDDFLLLANTDDSGAGKFHFKTNSTTEAMTISGTNVGIGTTGPSEKFSVVSADDTEATNIARFYANNLTQSVAIGYQSVRQTYPATQINFNAGTTGVIYLGNSSTGGTNIGSAGGNTVLNQSSGNVGIGTTAPLEKLEVNGFGLASRGFMFYDSYFEEDFNKATYQNTDATVANTTGNFGWGDNGSWGVDENTVCAFNATGDTSIGNINISTSGSSCLAYSGTTSANTAKDPWNFSQLPTILMKGGPSTTTTNQVWMGLAAGNIGTASSSDAASGVWFTNNTAGGANWVGQTCNATTCSTTSSCGAVVAGANALMMIKTNSSSSLTFYIDTDISNGITLTDCGTLTTNISTANMGLFMQSYNSGTTSTLSIDYVRIWADDPVIPNTITNDQTQPVYNPITGADIAEYYPTIDTTEIKPGTIVSAISGDLPFVDISKEPYDKKAIGIVSTSPNQTLGMGPDNGSTRVALSGRVPLRIDPSSPSILAGDAITSSGNDGMGKKATKPGIMVGKALESWTPGSGKDSILVFVNLSWYDPDVYLTSIDNLKIQNSSDSLYQLTDTNNNQLINRIGAFAQIVVAKLKAGIGSFDKVETNLISPVANTDLIIDLQPDNSQGASRLVIKGVDDLEVASIDASGNASFSGEIAANSLEVASDATISGTLYADKIESERLNQIEELLRNVEESQNILAESVNWNVNTATASASIDKLVSSEIITNNFFVTGNAAITSLFVSDNLTTKSINSLDSTLSIQSLALAPVEIMGGKVRVETNGDVVFSGNVEVAGDLKLKGNIVVAADAPLTATESAQMVPGEINTNSTAGKAILTANASEIKIINSKINNNTLIYVTPLSSTQNKVLYVKSKDTGYFTVGFSDTLDADVEFNWWIIELQ